MNILDWVGEFLYGMMILLIFGIRSNGNLSINKAYDDFLFDHFFTSHHVDYRKKELNNNISFFKRIIPKAWKSALKNSFIFRLLFKSNYDVNGLQYVIQNFTQCPLKRDYSCVKKYKFDIESLNVLHDLFLLRNRSL